MSEDRKSSRKISVHLTTEEYAILILKLNRLPEKTTLNKHIRNIIVDYINKKDKK